MQIKQPQPVAQNAQVDTVTWVFMIFVALFFDAIKALLQLLPVIGQILAIIIGWFAFGTFWLWFTIIGAKYSKTTMIGGFVSDFIPVLDILSETATILFLFFQSKTDKVVAKVPGGKTLAKGVSKI